jgi:predicted AlkP superfamily pyrophosphatase or phosphodiesterase
MNLRILVPVGLSVLLAGSAAQAPPPRVVLISIDGLLPSAYTEPGPAKIPHLRALAASGAWASGVRGVVPTVTYPSHTTLITGVTPAVHGILDNTIVDPEGRSQSAWYWYAEAIKVRTLVGAVRERGGPVGSIGWPVTVGLRADYNVPEFWRSDHIETLSLIKALSRPDGLLDDVAKGRGRALGWPQTDRDRTDIAVHVLRQRPALLLLHLLDLDWAQHDHGPGTPQALEALERVDGYVGDVLRVLDETGERARTVVAVVSDHGFRSLTTQLQPNTRFREEGLIRVDAGGRITSWDAYFHSSGGAGFVYLSRPDDDALRARVQKLLEGIQADPANGIEVLWTRADLTRLGAHPDAAFGIGLADGFYSSIDHDVLRKPSRMKGGHGFDPANPELLASFIISGPGIPARGDLGLIRMTQIAPTLARLLGVRLSEHADESLWGGRV